MQVPSAGFLATRSWLHRNHFMMQRSGDFDSPQRGGGGGYLSLFIARASIGFLWYLPRPWERPAILLVPRKRLLQYVLWNQSIRIVQASRIGYASAKVLRPYLYRAQSLCRRPCCACASFMPRKMLWLRGSCFISVGASGGASGIASSPAEAMAAAIL